jgi:hypothetical protein
MLVLACTMERVIVATYEPLLIVRVHLVLIKKRQTFGKYAEILSCFKK